MSTDWVLCQKSVEAGELVLGLQCICPPTEGKGEMKETEGSRNGK